MDENGDAMKTNTEYMVAVADEPGRLAEYVNEFMAEGWLLWGGVSVASYVGGRHNDEVWFQYAQALVKETLEAP